MHNFQRQHFSFNASKNSPETTDDQVEATALDAGAASTAAVAPKEAGDDKFSRDPGSLLRSANLNFLATQLRN